jgi:F-type H+-transporting ATPase subunit a
VAKPIDQFKIEPIVPLSLGDLRLDFTNSALFMMLAVGIVTTFLLVAMSNRSLVPSRTQSVAEMWYGMMASLVRGSMGHDGMRFFPLIFSLFSFVLLLNLLGMVPYFFTVTSQIIITFALALLVILTVVVVGFAKHGTHFFNLFVPSGVPGGLLPFIVVIEVISFLSRPISLSMRLFANMLGGHIALKVFAIFVIDLAALGGLYSLGIIGPLALGVALTALEFLIAFLQAYVFALLASSPLPAALHPGHH